MNTSNEIELAWSENQRDSATRFLESQSALGSALGSALRTSTKES